MAKKKAAKKTAKKVSKKKKPPADLQTMVTVAAWQDPVFAELVQKDPEKAVRELAKEYNIQVPRGVKFTTTLGEEKTINFSLAKNPAGDPRAKIAMAKGPGHVPTITADCWCGDTTTGKCSCGSLFGTPCLACRTSTSRCFCND